MIITLKRTYKCSTYTIGDLSLNGKWFCNTIEDRIRLLPNSCPDTSRGAECRCRAKVYSETAIPPGKYKVILAYSPRFKRILPRLLNVPHFTGILIHSGNDETATSGCIIVGKNTIKGKVTNSRKMLEDLMKILEAEKDIEIEII